MLKVGIIGYGGRVSGMAKLMKVFDIPFNVSAIADQRIEEIKTEKDEFLNDTKFYKNADEMLKIKSLTE